MYIGFYNNTKQFNKNVMLTDPSSPIGDNLNYPFVLLARELIKQGHKTITVDMDDIEKFDAVVFVEFPGLKNGYFKKLIIKKFKNLYLIASESPIINPDNYRIENHAYFKKIFTLQDDLIDNKKYFRLNYSHKFPDNLNFNPKEKNKLCCLIASNKFTPDPKELYSERIKAIRWFEKHHPDDFDLYGKGWDRRYFYGRFLGINSARLNRLKFLAKLISVKYPSYKGEIKSKRETYKKYKFAVCYENAENFNGYITEKIIDCFLGTCVPVYLGAPNIKIHIPENAFIDKRTFKTYDDLYRRIKNMPEKDYANYLENINKFLKSEKAYPFTAEYFAETISREITK